MGRWLLREPLLHFAVLGGLVFLFSAWINPESGDSIRIDAVRIAERYQRTTGTPADEATLDALIDREIERALLFREALALRLGDGDEIVRRRLIQKMELVLDEALRPAEPDDATLTAFLAADPRRFATAARRTIRHVFFVHASGAPDRALDALESLRTGADPATLGDPFLRGGTLGPNDEATLARVVDAEFAARVFAEASDDWFGPVRSTYGLHVVRIADRTPRRLPKLDDVRRSVRLAWTAQEAERRRAEAIALLRDKYAVDVQGR